MNTADALPFDPKFISLLWAEEGQAGAIAELHATLFDRSWDEDSVRKMLQHPGSAALLAKVRTTAEEKPLTTGFILGQIAADEAEILSLGVAQPMQRRGIGRRLVEGLIRAASRAEANKVFLEVAEDNVAALGLYSALEFQEVSRRQGYYQRGHDAAVDAVVLQRGV